MSTAETDILDAMTDALATADTAVAFTGAGVSTASGIPSFRGAGGVWNDEYDPGDFRLDRFERDPAGFWADRVDLHETMYASTVAPSDARGDEAASASDAGERDASTVAPNAAHDALATLEDAGVLDAVITQNVDGLHAAAETETLLEIHGNARRSVCVDCGATTPTSDVCERVRDGETPPRCGCGGFLKPDVVLFGERLPEIFRDARRLARDADAFLVAGSSLTVEPAASLPETAARGGDLCIVNYDETPHDDAATAVSRSDVTDVLPALGDRLS
ncbi:SIR2 family NAD-dependent protein deacylase [Halarchaeum salinum]|uniref:NAD-dependent protein deacetylase n=1 Tax=Halarchaeum salinum TaxID=489912 RepID=A0AAV3S4H5_9EURY